jgi:NAD(P)-dependent dehydrogenase (short-subunit alcohol dehydrogenase family)
MPKILITGANRGFGLALADQFSESGYELYLVVRKADAAQSLKQSFPRAHILITDITASSYESELENWLADSVIDVVINNAGSGTKAPTFEQTKTEYLQKEFDTNCVAVLATVKGALASLVRAQHPQVINISSRRGSLTMQSELLAKGSGCSYSYRVSKAAQNMLTLCLADDLEEQNIRVVAIHPGRLLTDMAPKDAVTTPEQSAKKLLELVQSNKLKSRDFISLETGQLPW